MTSCVPGLLCVARSGFNVSITAAVTSRCTAMRPCSLITSTHTWASEIRRPYGHVPATWASSAGPNSQMQVEVINHASLVLFIWFLAAVVLRRILTSSVFSERHDALYVVGALDEAMELRGMRYHPIDIETSVIRTHKSIMEWYNLLTSYPSTTFILFFRDVLILKFDHLFI